MRKMFLDEIRPGKLLDVGCGDGEFLNLMRGAGWAVDGIDFDSEAIENAKRKYGLELRHGVLGNFEFAENSFDAITLKHVIEHVPDPIGLLREVRRILKTDGRMTVVTPNSLSFGHSHFKEYWFGLDPPRHLQVFSAKGIASCAERAGFQVIETRSTAANADIFIGASYSIRDSQDHRSSHRPAPSFFRTAKAVYGQYREHFLLKSSPDRGEEAVLLAEKA
jgi:2-polyprenyl-3-methyl-5-hydroxy-6-metoxy-1,4-benzoquinol methylase